MCLPIRILVDAHHPTFKLGDQAAFASDVSTTSDTIDGSGIFKQRCGLFSNRGLFPTITIFAGNCSGIAMRFVWSVQWPVEAKIMASGVHCPC
jgi:hypothetical protein